MKKNRIAQGITLVLICILFVTLPAEAKEKKEVSILFTHDLHSHLDETITKDGAIGGFGKLKTTIDKTKEAYPETLVLDAGDFSMGTLYQTIYEEEATELLMMGRIGYDATTIGNHEFDYKGAGFANMLKSAIKNRQDEKLPKILSANIDWEKHTSKENQEVKEAMDQYGSTSYTIFERDGVRIGVYGMMGKDSEATAPESGFVFEDIIETSKKMVKKLKEEKVDLIVALSHSGTWEKKSDSEDELLAEAVPEIDLIISGHTHTTLEKAIVYNNTYIVSVGSYGMNMGDVKLVRNASGRWDMKQYELIRMDDSVVTDPAVTEEVKRYKAKVESQYLSQFGYTYDQVLTRNKIEFTPIEDFGLEQKEDTLGNLISDSYIYAVQKAEGKEYEPVDLAIVASGVVRDSFQKEEITVSDAFNVSSLGIGPDRTPGYPLVSVYLTGKELGAIAEVDATVSDLMTGTRLYSSGAKWTYNLNRIPFNRVLGVTLVSPDGKDIKIEEDKLYRVVSGLYSTQMLGQVKKKSFGILSLEPKDKEGNVISDFEKFIVYDSKTKKEVKEWSALADYLKSESTVNSKYSKIEGRKTNTDSKNIIELLKQPNKITFILFGVLLFIIILLFLCIKVIRNKARAKKV